MTPRTSQSERAAQERATAPSASASSNVTKDIERLVAGENRDPHSVLGVHGDTVRAWWPGAVSATLIASTSPSGPSGRDQQHREIPMEQVHRAGVVEATVAEAPEPGYRVRFRFADGDEHEVVDPWSFWPTLGDVDLHLIGEGRHERLWEALGARPIDHQGAVGTAYSVWAPSARSVRVVGDWNLWDGRTHPMRSLGASGVWELFLPGVDESAHYKYEILTPQRRLRLKADPLARQTEGPPATSSVVNRTHHRWRDDDWLARRASASAVDEQMSVYEVHLGSWRRIPEEDNRSLTYAEAAEQLADYIADLGFTHVELLPIAEHPFEPSWGYQVTGYYAPTSRFGSPDELRAFVDGLHNHGLGVILDWVPAHFPKDDWALRRFDGTALYEHEDPRKGEHPDWGTLVFNFGRNEVRNFLLASALYWLREYHADGLRVDAVASMLYLDYSRKAGEWIPNDRGGRENLEAIEFIKEMNSVVHREVPGALTVAEESTAWDGVSRPVDEGGLGFSQKWNMGWMHDTLDYFHHEPVHRKHHHDELTFGLLYAFSESFVLPLSHDEVVHGKGSLLGKMPGDRWQRFANLRALYAWMWAHPGKQLLFMGGEIAQEREWSHERSLDWHLLDDPAHSGVRDLVRELNRVQRDEPALWRRDRTPEGFQWLEADDRANSVYAFMRLGADGDRPIVCVANLTPVPRDGYRVGLPSGGRWVDVLNSDDARFGGGGYHAGQVADAEDTPWHGQPHSAVLDLPPLAVRWLGNAE
jgi:1,4-alpha-glucan branching enzyme